MATISRAEMEAAIQSGGSVMLPDGRVVGTIDHLPTVAELAKGDPAKEAAAREALEARRRAIDVELAALAAPAPPKVEGKAPESFEKRLADGTAAARKADADLLATGLEMEAAAQKKAEPAPPFNEPKPQPKGK